MKHLMIVALAFLISPVLRAGVDAKSLKIQVYSILVSESADCSNPIAIFDNASPEEVDFLNKPKLGGGSLPDGSYPCIIVKMSDVIKFSPADDTEYCEKGVEYSIDLCRAEGQGSQGSTVDPDGVEHLCEGSSQNDGVANPVWLYLSTATPAGQPHGESFKRPLDNAANGLNLTSPFEVAGASAAKFIVDARGTVGAESGQSHCGMEAPLFGFKKQ